jgi:MinD superfamily P-loop ATPase
VVLADCDVEEPNDHLFLGGTLVGTQTVSIPVPQVEASLCDACGECARICQYHAIVSFGSRPLLFPEMCHGCGGCAMVCPWGAILEVDRRIGVVETIRGHHITLVQGRLDVGAAMAPPLVRAVKARLPCGTPAIVDAPPGASCPVVATLRGVDVVALVTEPTPFGLHDLTIAVDMVRELGIPFGVVVNRVGIGDDRVHEFCRRAGIPVLVDIPEDRRIAEVYSRGGMIVDHLPEYRPLFRRLVAGVRALAEQPANLVPS